MFGCRRSRGLIAASSYEELSQVDQAWLNRHAARCAQCRTDAAQLPVLAAHIPKPPVEIGVDLWPMLRRRLAEPEPRPRRYAFPLVLAGAACATLAVIAVYTQFGAGPSPTSTIVAIFPVPASPVAAAMVQADSLTATRDYAGAFRVLEEAVAKNSNDPQAGTAQLRLAVIAYDELRWYEKAHAAHKTLMEKYWPTVAASPEMAQITEHWNLLDESRGESNFASLYALDAARRGRTDAFAQLEQVVSQYRGPYLTALAVREMAKLVDERAAEMGGAALAQAMETARSRCGNPLAIAQIKIELGNVYRDVLKDSGKARALYTEVAQGPDPGLARRAQQCLARLEPAN